ncbi:MAG: hemolysin III family protein [Rhodospirillaceae bacterium]
MPRDHGAEWFADAILNGASAAVAFIACLVMAYLAIRRARCMGDCPERHFLPLSLALYGLGLITMLICSTAYNLFVDHPQRHILRQIDHAAIFVMIAGTYSPLALLGVRGTAGQRLFAGVWAATNIGIVLKLTAPEYFEQLSFIAYLALGWVFVFVRGPLRATVPAPGLWLLTAGCVLYTIGGIVFMGPAIPYQIPIWHGLVVAGATLHYASIVGYVTGPTALKLARASISRNP